MNSNNDNEANKSESQAGGNETGSNRIKDPENWTTGNEPMTGAQQSYIETLSGGDFDKNMTKAEAAMFIEEHKGQQQAGSQNTGTSNAVKDPDNWVTGEEDMTDAQRSYLKTLADQAGENVDENLSKAEASKQIENLQQKTGRGAN